MVIQIQGNRILGYLLCLSLVMMSCRKEISNQFSIVNQSGYAISELGFSGTVSGQSVQVGVNDTIDQVILTYTRRFRLTPKLMRLSIDGFDALGASFARVYHPTIPFSKKDLEANGNQIVITSELKSDTLWFKAVLN